MLTVVLRQTYRATKDSIPRARRAVMMHVTEFGVRGRTSEAIALALTEAFTNVVLHAYRDSRDRGEVAVEVEMLRSDQSVEVRVIDTGLGLTPRSDSPGLGLGLPIIAEVADELQLRSSEAGGTELTMRFSLVPT